MKNKKTVVLAVCGWSGSGKTTLLESVIPVLSKKGLKVGVIKHTSSGINIDQPGKDSDRLFKSGAHIALQSEKELTVRMHRDDSSLTLNQQVDFFSEICDIILVEGHKAVPLPKVWLKHPEKPDPEGLENVISVLPLDQNRSGFLLDTLDKLIEQATVL